jgi:hypothetical protein
LGLGESAATRVLCADNHLRENGDHVAIRQRISQRQPKRGSAAVDDHNLVMGGDLDQRLRRTRRIATT